jgi:4-aminobutyrate aminotransferase / (S)-3-amino-2-methylpropionate transaminase / 5-aminovalerate transaminase
MAIHVASRKLEELGPQDVPLLKTPLPGPKSTALFAREQRFASAGISAVSTLSRLVLQDAYGCLLRDVDGNVLIDFGFGMVGVSTGHRHPVVVRALDEVLDRYLHVYDMATPERVELFEYLTSILPEQIRRFQMYTTGSETVEAAMRLAKSSTGKNEFISLYRGFHGKTLGSMALMGGGMKKGFGPLPGGTFQSHNAYCYRCPLNLTYPECGVACADQIENVFEQQTTGDVAAVVVEPMQAAGGMIIPPNEFLQKIRAFCDRKGLLLIIDEIFTGAGRTGKMWGYEHSGVVGDVVTAGKGIGSGFPVGLLASSSSLGNEWPWAQYAGSTTTFGGNAVAAVAALATLKVIVDERLAENAAVIGKHMLTRFRQMQDRFDFIGDVRGEGLMIGLELVRDKETKEPLAQELCGEIFRHVYQRGLLIPNASYILRIVPPLTITRELADRGLDIFEEALEAFSKTARLN